MAPVLVALSFRAFAQASIDFSQQRATAVKDSLRPSRAWTHWKQGDSRVDPSELPAGSTNTDGWATLRKMYETFDFIDTLEGFKRTHMQRRMHQFFLEASLRIIFGNSFAANVGRLMRYFTLRRLRQEALVGAPRRHGKTQGTATYTGVAAYSIPYLTTNIYSTGRRASQSYLTLQYKITCLLSNGPDMVLHYNQETLTLRDLGNQYDTRVTKSFPSNPKARSVFVLCGGARSW